MSQAIKLTVHQAYGFSIGNMIDSLSDNTSAESESAWITVKKVSPGVYQIVDNSMTTGDSGLTDCCALGFCYWDDEVQDIDAGNSDESQCFEMSDHLRWNDVDITPEGFKAPSINRLREALKHVGFCAWCPGDI